MQTNACLVVATASTELTNSVNKPGRAFNGNNGNVNDNNNPNNHNNNGAFRVSLRVLIILCRFHPTTEHFTNLTQFCLNLKNLSLIH